MDIRKAKEEDLKRILELELNLFSSPWSEQDYLYEINSNEYSHLFVIEDDGFVVGYSGLWTLFDQAQIITIGIDSKYQGKGLAKSLMSHMEKVAVNNECEIITLEVRVSNTKAINLYEGLGYTRLNIRKSYYSDNNEDAYLYGKGIGNIGWQ